MCPPLCTDSTFNCRIIHEQVAVIYQFMSPVRLEDMPQVEHYAAIFRVVVGVFVETDFISTCQFHVYAEVIQAYGVITRSRFFGVLIEKTDRFD